MLKKVISYILCLCLCLTVISGGFAVNAATLNAGKLTVSTIDGITGDSVIVPIMLEENPGIMAVSISITYDSQVLTYEGYDKGEVLNDYMVVDHPTKNLIRLVSLCDEDTTNDGVFISFKFKISDSAPMGLQPIDIVYSSGDFCNKGLDRIMPAIVKGGINVAFNGSNCSHKEYGEWTVASKPSCDSTGHDQRICKSCGHTELKQTDPIGHEYPDYWTVTKEATPEEDGTMARLCIRCNDPVDEITFPYKDVEDGKVDNEEDKPITDNDYAEDKFEEQNPGQELTPSKPGYKPDDSSGNTTDENTSNSSQTENTDSTNNSSPNTGSVNSSDKNQDNSSSNPTNNSKDDKNNIVDNVIDSIVDSFTDDETVEKVEEATKELTERIAAAKEKILEVVPNLEIIIEFYKSLFMFIVSVLFI